VCLFVLESIGETLINGEAQQFTKRRSEEWGSENTIIQLSNYIHMIFKYFSRRFSITSLKDGIKRFMLADYPIQSYEDTFQSTTKGSINIYNDMLKWITKHDYEILEKNENASIAFRSTSSKQYIKTDFTPKPIFYSIELKEEPSQVNITGKISIKDERNINVVVKQSYGIVAELLVDIGIKLPDEKKRRYFTNGYKIRVLIRESNVVLSLFLIALFIILYFDFSTVFNYITLLGLILLVGWFIFDFSRAWNYLKILK
jgi:hypothetical protein